MSKEYDILNKRLQDEELLLEMANISKNDYNTPVGLWVDELGNKRKTKHNEPRMKFVNNYDEDFTDLFDISISKNPELKSKGKLNISNSDLNKIKKFISKNYDIFMKRWNNEISTKEMFNLLDSKNLK